MGELGDFMGALIIQGVVIIAIVAFLVFLAYDDRRNTRQRDAEDKMKALQQQKEEQEKEKS